MDTDGTLDQKSGMRTWSGRQDDPNYPICASMTWGLHWTGELLTWVRERLCVEILRRGRGQQSNICTFQQTYGDVWRAVFICSASLNAAKARLAGLDLSALADWHPKFSTATKTAGPETSLGSSCNDSRGIERLLQGCRRFQEWKRHQSNNAKDFQKHMKPKGRSTDSR